MPTLTRLQRVLDREPNAATSVGGVALCVVVPTALRWALSTVVGEQTPWFALYYPALLIAAVVLGWRWAFLTLLFSAVVADFLFLPPAGAVSIRAADVVAVLVFIFTGGAIIVTATLLRQAILRLNRSMALQDVLNRELQHRVNNNLAVVQALAAQTARSSPDLETFRASFEARLAALSQAQRILDSGDWQSCDFPDLPRTALEPFDHDGRIRLDGPRCSVPAAACVPLVLALHELATNAAKYGALSVPGGQVALIWRLREAGEGLELAMEWSENGGPQVTPPSRRGLGSRLLRPQMGIAEVQVDYDPAGLRCTMVVQEVTALSQPARPSAAIPRYTTDLALG